MTDNLRTGGSMEKPHFKNIDASLRTGGSMEKPHLRVITHR